MKVKLSKRVINQVESILRSYPYWLISIECRGLGTSSRYLVEGDRNCVNGSSVEYAIASEEKTKKRIEVVEKVHFRLSDMEKKVVELAYYQDFSTDDVIVQLNISRTKFYSLKKQILIKYALAFGFIEEM